jgi:hypothetical protein
MSALCIENFTLGQGINECLMHGELVLRTAHKLMDKLSMYKAFIYVLSQGQVLHAQDIHLCSVLRSSYPCTRHSVMSYECPVHGEFALRTGHERVPYALRTLH